MPEPKELNRLVTDYLATEGENEKTALKLKECLRATKNKKLQKFIKRDLANAKTTNDVKVAHCAAKNNHIEILSRIFNTSSSEDAFNLLKSQTTDGRTAFHYAAQSGAAEAISIMLSSVKEEQRVKLLELKAYDGITALHYSSYFGGVDTVEHILTHVNPADRISLLKLQSDQGNTALHSAVDCGDADTIEYMLNKMPPDDRVEVLKLQNKAGNIVLHYAAASGDVEVIKAILDSLVVRDKIALLVIRNMEELTATEEAKEKGNNDAFNCLHNYAPKPAKRKQDSKHKEAEPQTVKPNAEPKANSARPTLKPKPKINSLTKKLKGQERTLKVVNSNIFDYKTKYTQCTKRIKQLKRKLGSVEVVLKNTQREKEAVEEKCASLEQDRIQLNEQKDENNNEMVIALKEVAASNKELAESNRLLAASNLASLEAKANSDKLRLEELEKEKERLERKEQKVSNQLNESTKRLDRLNEKITALETAETVNKQELKEYRDERKVYEQRIDKLEQKKEEIIQQKDECVEKIRKIRSSSSSDFSSSKNGGSILSEISTSAITESTGPQPGDTPTTTAVQPSDVAPTTVASQPTEDFAVQTGYPSADGEERLVPAVEQVEEDGDEEEVETEGIDDVLLHACEEPQLSTADCIEKPIKSLPSDAIYNFDPNLQKEINQHLGADDPDSSDDERYHQPLPHTQDDDQQKPLKELSADNDFNFADNPNKEINTNNEAVADCQWVIYGNEKQINEAIKSYAERWRRGEPFCSEVPQLSLNEQ